MDDPHFGLMTSFAGLVDPTAHRTFGSVDGGDVRHHARSNTISRA
jgi:hypothetical protein